LRDAGAFVALGMFCFPYRKELNQVNQSFCLIGRQYGSAPQVAFALGRFGGEYMPARSALMPEFAGRSFAETFRNRLFSLHFWHGFFLKDSLFIWNRLKCPAVFLYLFMRDFCQVLAVFIL
jgi:hypothetical protein